MNEKAMSEERLVKLRRDVKHVVPCSGECRAYDFLETLDEIDRLRSSAARGGAMKFTKRLQQLDAEARKGDQAIGSGVTVRDWTEAHRRVRELLYDSLPTIIEALEAADEELAKAPVYPAGCRLEQALYALDALVEERE